MLNQIQQPNQTGFHVNTANNRWGTEQATCTLCDINCSPQLCSPPWPWWSASSWALGGPPARTCGWRGGLLRTSSCLPAEKRGGSPCGRPARPARAASCPWKAVSSSHSPERTSESPAAGTWALGTLGPCEPFRLWGEVVSSSPWLQQLLHSCTPTNVVLDGAKPT